VDLDSPPEPALEPRAQFLNVIESIFSGMARAIIHNSDYKSVDDAKSAIDCYFDERNRHFLAYPRRAGNKIWGKERVPRGPRDRYSVSANCFHTACLMPVLGPMPAAHAPLAR
jgi:hypothetical protein